MKKREPVSHIMSTQLQVVNQTQSLKDVSDLMEAHKIRHIPVVSGPKVIGMVSKTDIARMTYGKASDEGNQGILESLTVGEVMTQDLDLVTTETSIREVAEIFVEKDFSALPVVEDDKLCGIVTTKDVMRFLMTLY